MQNMTNYMTSSTTPDDIGRVLDKHPDLGVFGFGYPPPAMDTDFLHQVHKARQWLNGGPDRSRAIQKHGSYTVKHMMERALCTYIANGAAITAALLEGFEPIRKRPGPNCFFRRVL